MRVTGEDKVGSSVRHGVQNARIWSVRESDTQVLLVRPRIQRDGKSIAVEVRVVGPDKAERLGSVRGLVNRM